MRIASRAWLTALLATVALVGACDDDDDGNGPDGPDAPTNVAAAATSPTSVDVTWDAVDGADGYVVQRVTGATGGTFATVGTPATNTFTDNTVAAATTYRYRVATVEAGAQSSYSAEASVTTSGGEPEIIDADITADMTLTADREWILSGFIHVANGAKLTIEPGTIIRGDADILGSSLFILRGAEIDAQGTETQPIVFTSEVAAGGRQAGDWGGLIIVGNGIINRGTNPILEGTGTDPVENPEITYGDGNDNADNSGILRYVRIEFAGFGPAPNQELNGLTLAADGSGTTIEFIQVLNGLDDSFEWFGGAVDAKHLVSYESGDDHYDMAEGYVGRLQHLIAFQSKVVVPRPGAGNVSSDPQGFENDGCNAGDCAFDATPFTQPLVANFTVVGPADGVFAANSGGYGMVLRRGTAGYYVNGLVARWEKAAYSLRDPETAARVADGTFIMSNIVDAEVGVQFHAGQTGGTFDPGTFNLTASALTAAATFTALPADPAAPGDFNWGLAAGSEANTGGLNPFTGDILTKAGAFVTATSYRGAVDPVGAQWYQGWTNYADN